MEDDSDRVDKHDYPAYGNQDIPSVGLLADYFGAYIDCIGIKASHGTELRITACVLVARNRDHARASAHQSSHLHSEYPNESVLSTTH